MSGLSFQEITVITFQAVLEVVIICFAGFVAAKTNLLTVNGQKIVSQLNVDLFTPCLVFSKLAPSLSLQKIIDIIIIPIFYALSTGISYGCSRFTSKILKLNEPESNYVTAMSVFGNSNSLPVSLTLTLAYTLPNLNWSDIDDDTPDKIASRGILYLLIFQQLGQVLRWSWGYNTLLRKRDPKELRDYNYENHDDDEESNLLSNNDQSLHTMASENESLNDEEELNSLDPESFTNNRSKKSSTNHLSVDGSPNSNSLNSSSTDLITLLNNINEQSKLQRTLHKIKNYTVVQKFLSFMNPPLYSMLLSVIVASIPSVQHQFFTKNGFVQNTLSSAIKQLGSVSIPLILIVLGSNLAPSKDIPPPSSKYTKIVMGSLISRMILPPIFLLPIIAIVVKFFQISILDDPIFLIVSFILTVSPPAIQLSQICQLNNLYQREMAGVLFWGYVVLTLPTTIFIVVSSLEVLEWANPNF